MSISSSNTKKAQCAACDRQAGDAQCGFCAQKAKKFPDAASDAASVASTKKVGACFYCKEEGHVVADCPQLAAKQARVAAAKARAARQAQWTCRFCNQKGHLQRACPDNAAQKAAEAAYMVRGPRAATMLSTWL